MYLCTVLVGVIGVDVEAHVRWGSRHQRRNIQYRFHGLSKVEEI
jgi:hypothetical protein